MSDRERLAFWLAFIFESLAKRLEEDAQALEAKAKELRACI